MHQQVWLASGNLCKFQLCTLVYLATLIVLTINPSASDPLWPSIDQSEYAQPGGPQNGHQGQARGEKMSVTQAPLKMLELKGKSSRSRMNGQGCAEHYNSGEFVGQGGTGEHQGVLQQSSRVAPPTSVDPVPGTTTSQRPATPTTSQQSTTPAAGNASKPGGNGKVDHDPVRLDIGTMMITKQKLPIPIPSIHEVRGAVWKNPAEEPSLQNPNEDPLVATTESTPNIDDEMAELEVRDDAGADAMSDLQPFATQAESQGSVPSTDPPVGIPYVGASSAVIVPNYNDGPSAVAMSTQSSNTKHTWMTAMFHDAAKDIRNSRQKDKKADIRTTATTTLPATYPPEPPVILNVELQMPAFFNQSSGEDKQANEPAGEPSHSDFSAEELHENDRDSAHFPSVWPSTNFLSLSSSGTDVVPKTTTAASTKRQHHVEPRKKAFTSTEEEKSEKAKTEEAKPKSTTKPSTQPQRNTGSTTTTTATTTTTTTDPPEEGFEFNNVLTQEQTSSAMPDSTTTTESSLPAAKMMSFSSGDDVTRSQRQQNASALFDDFEAGVMSKRAMTIQQLNEYIQKYVEEVRVRSHRKAAAAWDYSTNITQSNSAKKINATLDLAAWKRSEWQNHITRFDYPLIEREGSDVIKRMFKMIKNLGMAALDDEKMAQRTNLITDMQEIYGKAKICPYKNQSCNVEVDRAWALDPDLAKVMKKAANYKFKDSYDLLSYCWQRWRDATGRKMRKKFADYVKLSNDGARANNDPKIKDTADLWLDPYETENFKEDVARLYSELKPFYQELHAFVRYKLREHYGKDKFAENGPLPAHILGNMWAQSWEALFPIVSEFKAPSFDVTKEMKKRKFSVKRMFEIADDFFVGLGLTSVKQGATDFYGRSMLTRPSDGTRVVCHASAWDFMATNSLPGDFRVKMCAQVSMKDLVTIHHEMCHIQYYMQYVNQTPIFRSGANPAFHEAIGDTLALSAASTKHLKAIGLLDKNYEQDKNTQLAFLLRTALAKIPFLPYSYVVDLYRWKVFNGSIPMDKLNSEWWKLRQAYQGLIPPVARSEEDFDPGAKYHVAASVPYVRYFVAHILQFSFHQALCQAAGQFDPQDPQRLPLHMCYIGGSTGAGDKLKKLLQAGSSRHWKDVMFEMTGSREMSVKPILNYFKPLRDYLRTYFDVYNIPVGWDNWEKKDVVEHVNNYFA